MDISLFFHRKEREVKDKSSRRFDDWSKKYDRSILQHLVFRQSRELFLKNILHDSAISTVLDVGCGTGEFAVLLKQSNKKLKPAGVDLSDKMIKTARKKARSCACGDIVFKVGDVGSMPFDNNSFDCVTCAHSFHHYPLKKKAMREMFRVLKNNGKIMIIDGYKDNLLGRFIFDFLVKRHEVDVHHLHSNQFRRLLTSAGFNNIVQKTFNPLIPLLFIKGVAGKETAC